MLYYMVDGQSKEGLQGAIYMWEKGGARSNESAQRQNDRSGRKPY
jgi:hypothetical protein